MDIIVPTSGLDVLCKCSVTVEGMNLHDLIKVSECIKHKYKDAIVDDFTSSNPRVTFTSPWTPPHTLLLEISTIYNYTFILSGNFRDQEITTFIIRNGDIINHKQGLI